MSWRAFRTWLFLLAIPAMAAPGRAAAPDLFLEVEIEPARTHVLSQAVYRLRLFQGVDVRDLKMGEPFAPLADFRPTGPGRTYEAVRDGRRFRVHERSYAVFPFASGPLEIPGPRAEGRRPGFSGNSPGGAGAVRLEAPARVLTVLPLPDQSRLAARSLALEETWPPAGEMKVGDVLRRVIRLEAAGVDAGHLPEIGMEIPGVAVHAEPPRLENRFQGEINIGVREQSFRLVPRRPGPVAVPELRLPWWNVQAGAAAVALLPARTLEVAGEPPVPLPPGKTAEVGGESLSILAALAAGAVLVLALMAWWIGRGGRLILRWKLRRACRSGDARTVRDALLAWAALNWPEDPPRTLEALAGRFQDPGARQSLRELERALYGPDPGAWEPARLDRLVRLAGQCIDWRSSSCRFRSARQGARASGEKAKRPAGAAAGS